MTVSGSLALTVAAVFAGAAIYVALCEQPARLALDDRALLQEWKPSYKRGAAMQASLSIIACVLGAIAWWQSDDWRWLAGTLAIIAPWPYTLLIIKPTNDQLLSTDLAAAGPRSRTLIEKWGKLHWGRTAFGILGTLAFLAASLS